MYAITIMPALLAVLAACAAVLIVPVTAAPLTAAAARFTAAARFAAAAPRAIAARFTAAAPLADPFTGTTFTAAGTDTPAKDTAAGSPAHAGPKPTGGNPLERVTVNLILRASRALQRVSELTGDSKTDSINRAILVYSYLTEVDCNGGDVYVREPEDSEPRRLKVGIL